MDTDETTTRLRGSAAIREASRFFVQTDAVYDSLREIASRLTSLDIPYAVVGGMALVAHGYRRTTAGVNVLVTPDGLETIHCSLVGLGYVPLFQKSKHLRDTRTGVRIEFIVTGQYPGDGKPKPVSFPDPDAVAVTIDGIRYIALPALIELKLASGMTNPGRLRDLADVQEMIRVLALDELYAQKLNPFVRNKYRELAADIRKAEHDEQE